MNAVRHQNWHFEFICHFSSAIQFKIGIKSVYISFLWHWDSMCSHFSIFAFVIENVRSPLIICYIVRIESFWRKNAIVQYTQFLQQFNSIAILSVIYRAYWSGHIENGLPFFYDNDSIRTLLAMRFIVRRWYQSTHGMYKQSWYQRSKLHFDGYFPKKKKWTAACNPI